jgi:hypothetical protein
LTQGTQLGGVLWQERLRLSGDEGREFKGAQALQSGSSEEFDSPFRALFSLSVGNQRCGVSED